LKDYLEQIATAFGPIPEGDGIAPARLDAPQTKIIAKIAKPTGSKL
jgi:hypothetical protein